ncbi:daunorubicin resistance protein DrrA family ABC transporter ATP-binding protein [Saccharomonospora xinjiangensis]|uniref:Daunorubicin resistance ABC transporter ATP-binding subunit n=1 Tax=Saccharomonospora xinjiangensis XJ-54 TaxID=882086 RepID=I0V364_9PSEU|nr:daunorubicin resistance protein DrrA family ABC transporter ATP-binding protein [Saccharomonospora xinjiangensis]EID54567.1 daunorubicin resistance ABC transporter ATP-binding subunit [Saccharomonospora xinjiangensis XJ-54]
MTSAIRAAGLTKSFGTTTAVAGIDLDVGHGELFGFLGPNGAGKSSAVKVLCTLTEPTEGTAVVAGHDVRTERHHVRRRIGAVFQEPTLDVFLSAEQNLRFHGELHGLPKKTLRRRIDEVLDFVGLAKRRHDPIVSFSGGMRRKLEICRGLLHTPQVLFLDEPTIGLDPHTRASVWEYIATLREAWNVTVFLTTHYLDEAEHCDRIAIMNEGRIVALDTPDALKRTVGADRIRLRTADDDAALAHLRNRLGLDAALHDGSVTFTIGDGAAFVPRLFEHLDVAVHAVTVTRPSLDDVFMTYTGRTISTPEGATR